MNSSVKDYLVGIDTGSNTFSIPKKSDLAIHIINTYGLKEENKITNERNGKIVYRYLIKDFFLGTHPLGEMVVIISDMADYMGNGILGYDFFYNNLVFIDFHRSVLYIKKAMSS